MRKILIYGFEPFKHYRRNITADLLQHLPPHPAWKTVVLPVRFEAQIFLDCVAQHQPDAILGLGQCPRGQMLRLERKGHNQMRERKAGLDAPIDPEGPAEILTPWKIRPRSRQRISYDAGRYVCNYSIYLLSRYAQEHHLPYAFIHVPRTYPLQRGVQEISRILQTLSQARS